MSVERQSKSQAFVEYVLDRGSNDSGFMARLRRADNPATEYQSWDILAGFGVRLDSDEERLPYALVGAAIAHAQDRKNGSMGLGRAVAAAFDGGNQSDQANVRIRRVLGCKRLKELCRVLRPLLRLIHSRTGGCVNYASLLSDLLYFNASPSRIKTKWAQQFYGNNASSSQNGSES